MGIEPMGFSLAMKCNTIMRNLLGAPYRDRTDVIPTWKEGAIPLGERRICKPKEVLTLYPPGQKTGALILFKLFGCQGKDNCETSILTAELMFLYLAAGTGGFEPPSYSLNGIRFYY